MVLFGCAPGVSKNFVTWLVSELQNGKPVSIVTDQYGTPTFADDLARALLVIYEKDGRGLYHAAGGEWLNRYDFAVRIAGVFGLESSRIHAITTAELRQSAPRPLKSGLINKKVRKDFGISFSLLEDALRKMRRCLGVSAG
jgi:dTDP-4-dehydrorhamnose reductase